MINSQPILQYEIYNIISTLSEKLLFQVTTLGEDDDAGSGEGSVEQLMEELTGDSDDVSGGGSSGGESSEEDPIEMVHVDEDFFYMAHVMRLAAILHSLVSLAMLIAYYHLKVMFLFDPLLYI